MKFAKTRPATAKSSPRRTPASCEIKPKPSKKDVESIDRLSFQGFVGGGTNSMKNSPEIDSLSLEATAKVNRLRNSIIQLRHSAQSDQIRMAIESAMNEALKDFVVDGTPEERLQAIMTVAKESGITLDKLFSHFQGESSYEGHITAQGFWDALGKLADSMFMVSEEEMKEIVKKFDVNGDGMISLAEFKAYCLFQIPGVAWKAERQRLESSGEILQITAGLKEGFQRGEIKIYPCGDEVYRASKLFWQKNISVEMELFYCAPMDVVTVRLSNLSNGDILPLLYVKKSECKVANKVKAEDVFLPTQVSGVQLTENESLGQIKEEWLLIGKYILARLKLKQSPGGVKISENSIPRRTSTSIEPYLCKLSGDALQSLTIAKPINIGDPPPVDPNSRATLVQFQHALTSFQQDSLDLRSSRQSAQLFSASVEDALKEIRNEFG